MCVSCEIVFMQTPPIWIFLFTLLWSRAIRIEFLHGVNCNMIVLLLFPFQKFENSILYNKHLDFKRINCIMNKLVHGTLEKNIIQ